jgi:hypothetical protein
MPTAAHSAPQFLSDQAYQKHSSVTSWPLAIIASSNEQIYTRPIGSRLFSHLESAFRHVSQESPAASDGICSPTSTAQINSTTALRRFFSEILDTVKSNDGAESRPPGFGEQGIILASGCSSGIESAELQSIFYNCPQGRGAVAAEMNSR